MSFRSLHVLWSGDARISVAPRSEFPVVPAIDSLSYCNPHISFARTLNAFLLVLPLVAVYKRYGSDTISIVPFLWGLPKIWTGNLDVARQITAGGPTSPWIKPTEYSAALL